MSRYFVTSSATFGFSGPVGDQVIAVTANIYVDSVLKGIVSLGSGIAEVESPPTVWTYHIVDKELSFSTPPSPGTVSIEWKAQNAGLTNADTYPTLTAPTLDTVADPTLLAITTSTPAALATDVSTRDAVVIDFDDDLDTTNVEFDRMIIRQVQTNQAVQHAAYIVQADKSKLVLKPSSRLSDNTTYEVFIENESLYSTGGNRMGSDYTLRFTTGTDNFSTIVEATTHGVIERSGPIVLAPGGSSLIITPPVASISSSTPPDCSYVFDGTTLVVNFSEDLDIAIIPTITFEVSSIFGMNEYYYVNNAFWGKVTPPIMPALSIPAVVLDNTVTITLDTAFPGNAEVTVTVSGAETAATNTVVPDDTITFYTYMFPFRVGVPEVKRLIPGYLSSDITDCVIAQAITQVGLDVWLLVGNRGIPQQRCIIKHLVALQLMDDWLAERGGGLSESKTLGAFSVRRGMMATPPTYAKLMDELEKCWLSMKSFINGIGSAIKSSSHPMERPDYRIRTWREAQRYEAQHDIENGTLDRNNKLPGPNDSWS